MTEALHIVLDILLVAGLLCAAMKLFEVILARYLDRLS